MKKIVIVNGTIAGLIVTIMMVIGTTMLYGDPNFEGSMILGYAGMLAAFSLIFVGIKMYRDKYNNGVITFGQAFKIGILISLIASTIYVLVWLVEYYFFIPDFMDKYSDHLIKGAQGKGLSESEINSQIADASWYKELYKNPVLIILVTYMEVFPIGLLVTLIAAFILKRKKVVVA